MAKPNYSYEKRRREIEKKKKKEEKRNKRKTDDRGPEDNQYGAPYPPGEGDEPGEDTDDTDGESAEGRPDAGDEPS